MITFHTCDRCLMTISHLPIKTLAGAPRCRGCRAALRNSGHSPLGRGLLDAAGFPLLAYTEHAHEGLQELVDRANALPPDGDPAPLLREMAMVDQVSSVIIVTPNKPGNQISYLPRWRGITVGWDHRAGQWLVTTEQAINAEAKRRW